MNTADPNFRVNYTPENNLLTMADTFTTEVYHVQPLPNPGHYMTSRPIEDPFHQAIADALSLTTPRIKHLDSQIFLISIPNTAYLIVYLYSPKH